jgi:tetratricopeptide (TPR) repeat protein
MIKAFDHLEQFLQIWPLDQEALSMMSELAVELALANPQERSDETLQTAITYNERLLRLLDPQTDDAQDVRKRLVKLYIRTGELYRRSRQYQLAPELVASDLPYRPALIIAIEMVDYEIAQAQIQSRFVDPTVCRLEAMAREGLLSANDSAEPVIAGYKLTLLGGTKTDSTGTHQASCQGDPTDVVAAEHLVNLYLKRGRQQEAVEILDRLLRTNTVSASMCLLGYNFHLGLGNEERARAVLEAGLRTQHDHFEIRVAATSDALRRGDLAEARARIKEFPENQRRDPHFCLLEGLIAYNEGRPDEAEMIWRRGLIETGGSNEMLFWWLAYSQIQRNRTADGRRSLAQFQRLMSEGNEPLNQILQAALDVRIAKPTQAVPRIKGIRDSRCNDFYKSLADMILGTAYEQLGDELQALEAYRRASELNPNALEPYLSTARIYQRSRRTRQAIAVLKLALNRYPQSIPLLTALAQAYLEQESRRPSELRNFSSFELILRRIQESNPSSEALITLQATRLTLESQFEQANQLLDTALEAHLRETIHEAPSTSQPSRTNRSESLLLAYAESCRRVGRDDEALHTLERGVRRWNWGDRPTLRIARAEILIALHRGREALALLNRDFSNLPQTDQAQLKEAQVRLYVSLADIPGAIAACHDWSELAPDDPRPKLALLDLAFQANDDQLANAILEELQMTRTALKPPDENTLPQTDIAANLAQAAFLIRQASVFSTKTNRRDDPPSIPSKLITEIEASLEVVRNMAPELPLLRLFEGELAVLKGDFALAEDNYALAVERGNEAALPRLIGLLIREGNMTALNNLRRRISDGRVERLAIGMAAMAPKQTLISRMIRDAIQAPYLPIALRLQWAEWLGLFGQVDQAEELLQELAGQSLTEPEPWLALFRLRARKGDVATLGELVDQAKQTVATDRIVLFEARCLWAGGDLAKANQAFQKALEHASDDIETLENAALFAETNGNQPQAIAYLQRLLEQHPDYRPAIRQLAQLLAQEAASWQAAWTILGPEGSDETNEDRLTRALVLSRCPEPSHKARAIPILQILLSDTPALSNVGLTARKLLSRLWFESNYPDRAYQVLQPVVLNHSDSEALALALDVLLVLKWWDEADALIKRLDFFGGGELAASYRTRWITSKVGGTKAADGLVRAIEDADPVKAETLGREAFRALIASDPPALDTAELIARRLLDLNPGSSWMMATVLARRGMTISALDHCFEAARSGHGKDPGIAAELATTIAASSNATPEIMAKVEAVIKAARFQAPEDVDLIVTAANFDHRRGRYENEVRLCRDALARDPNHVVACNNLAWALSEGLHQPAEALGWIEQLIRRVGRKPAIVDTRGMILLRLGRWDDAINDLEEAAHGLPTGPVYFHLARAYHQTGRETEFRKYRNLVRSSGMSQAEVDPTERDVFTLLMRLP